MTHIFIESSSKSSNEYAFIKAVVSRSCKKDLDVHYDIVTVGGKDNRGDNFKNKLEDHDCQNEKNLIIFDADFKENGGGFKQRFKELEAEIKRTTKKFELFLFPDNGDDGTFENLLEDIINPAHVCLLDCFEKYENCIKEINDKKGKYQNPNQKAKMYAYRSMFKESNKKNEAFKNKGDWDFSNEEYWNLDSDALNPLKKFLKTHLDAN